IRERSSLSNSIFCSVGLRGILNDEQMMLAGDRLDPVHIGQSAVKMNGEHSFGFGCDSLRQSLGIEVKNLLVGLTQNGNQSGVKNSENAGDVGVGGNDDLIARP